MQVVTGRISGNTTATEYTVTGLPGRPALVLLFTGSSADTVAQNAAFHKCIGAFDQAGNKVSVYGRSNDNAGSAVTLAGVSTSHCALEGSTTSGLLDSRIAPDALANWPSDGFKLVLNAPLAGAKFIEYIAFIGTDFTGIAMGVGTTPGSTGTQGISTGLSGVDGFLIMGVPHSLSATDGTQGADVGSSWISVGASDGTNNWCMSGGSDDAAGTMEVNGNSQDSAIYVGAVLPGATWSLTGAAIASGASFSSGTVNLNWTSVSATAQTYVWVAWVGPATAVGTFLTELTATNTMPVTGLGFQPKGLFLASQFKPDATTLSSHDNFAVGVCAGTADRRSYAIHDQDALNTSDTGRCSQSTAMIFKTRRTATDGYSASAMVDLQSFDSDGFTAIQDTADITTQSLIGFIAFGDGVAAAALEAAVSGSASVGAALTTAITLAASLSGLSGADGATLRDSEIRLASAVAGGATVSAHLTRTPDPIFLFGTSDPGGTTDEVDATPLSVGVVFRSSVGGHVVGVRYWKDSLATDGGGGAESIQLWATDGTLLASAPFTFQSGAEGWMEARFPSVVAIQPDTNYVASVYLPAAGYTFTADYFQNSGATSGPLTAPQSSTVTDGNGRFKYGASPLYPNDTFEENNFWVSPLVVVLELAATPSGSATVAGALDGGAPAAALEAALAGSGSTTAGFTTAIAMAAAVSGAGTIAAPLSTQIACAANLTAAAATTANLTTQIALAASVSGSAVQTSALTTAIPFAVSLAGGATTSAGLTTAIRFAAAVSGAATIAGGMDATSAALAASAAGAGSTTASLTTAIRLEAAQAGSSSVTAALSTAIRFQSALIGASSTQAGLSTAIRMAASVAGAATTTASLTTTIRLTAALSGSGALAGALEGTVVQFNATVAGSASTTGALTTGIALAAAPGGAATTTAGLTTSIRMAAALAASGSVVAPLTTAKPIAAAVSGSSSTTAAITTAIALAAAPTGGGSIAGALQTAIRLGAQLSADATVAALLTETARFSAIQVVNESTRRDRVQAESCGTGYLYDESADSPGAASEDTP